MHDIKVRRMEFEFSEDLDPVFIEGAPEESYATIGFSLLLPYFEPYLTHHEGGQEADPGPRAGQGPGTLQRPGGPTLPTAPPLQRGGEKGQVHMLA